MRLPAPEEKPCSTALSMELARFELATSWVRSSRSARLKEPAEAVSGTHNASPNTPPQQIAHRLSAVVLPMFRVGRVRRRLCSLTAYDGE
jgi:hypothetical protein